MSIGDIITATKELRNKKYTSIGGLKVHVNITYQIINMPKMTHCGLSISMWTASSSSSSEKE